MSGSMGLGLITTMYFYNGGQGNIHMIHDNMLSWPSSIEEDNMQEVT